MSIHPTAVIDPSAEVGEDCEIGPYVVIEAGVRIGARNRIDPHCHLKGPMTMGDDCLVGTGAILGQDPQIKKNPRGPFGAARIGSRNVFREYAQVHRSMYPEETTVVGDDGFFMVGSHIAHDCIVGNGCVVANYALLGGHIEMRDGAILAGGASVHQFTRIGELCIIGGLSAVSQDVPPYAMVTGSRPAIVNGINVVGLRRAGFSQEVRNKLRGAFRTLFRPGDQHVQERIAAVEVTCPEVQNLLNFVRETKRGVVSLRTSKAPHSGED